MGPHTPTIDDTYRRYADLLLRHSRLVAERGDEDAETEAVEEEMTRLWDHLDAVQRRSLSGLGSDLNWARNGCQLAPRSRRPEDVTPQDFQSVVKARDEADWHGLLHHLRVCSPRTPPFQLAYLRGSAWSAIGFPHLGSLFYDLACELEPSNGSIAVLALRTAAQVDSSAALERARTILEDRFRRPAVAVVFAITMLLREGNKDDSWIDPRDAAELLRDCLERLDLEPPSDSDRAKTHQLAAIAFEFLGLFPEARRSYEEGLRLRPDNDTLLVGLGLLLYGREDEKAAELLSRAVGLQSPLVQPYLLLAHYHISRRHFDEGLKFCSQALARTTSDPVRAELLELAAICESELSFPDEAVGALFQKARELDPANERISKNQQTFEIGRHGTAGRPYDFEPADSFKIRRAVDILTVLARPAA